jgi:hypothetical protein
MDTILGFPALFLSVDTRKSFSPNLNPYLSKLSALERGKGENGKK